LSFKPSIPKSLLLDGPHTVETHFLLVNYQVSISYHLNIKNSTGLNSDTLQFLVKFSVEANKDCTCYSFIVEPNTGESHCPIMSYVILLVICDF